MLLDLPWVSKSPPTQQVAYQKLHSHTGNPFLYGGAKIKSIAIIFLKGLASLGGYKKCFYIFLKLIKLLLFS
jgi:hypothetical protein